MAALLIILLGAAIALAMTRTLDRRERALGVLAFGLHVVSSFGQWALQEFYYGVTDAFGQMDSGRVLARLLDYDFMRFAPEVGRLALHLESNLPFEAFGAGSSTGTMSALAGFFVWLVGDSLLSLCLVTTIISWAGQLCFYRIARDEVSGAERNAALFGCMFVPSVVFWGAAYAKEAFVMGGFGLLGLSTYRFIRQRRRLYLVGVALGALGVGLLKPYVLFPFVLATSSWIYADRAWKTAGTIRIRPAYLVLASVLAVGGIALMGTLFPEFGVNNIAETVADQQGSWLQATGGASNFALGDKEARTLTQQLPFIPLALINALFRPVIFEARNAPMFGAAIETTVITIGLGWLLLRHPWGATRRAVLQSPLIMFSLVFVVTFSIAVGLATSNLGSLSRYRVPMMPFYVTAVFLLQRRLASNERKPIGLVAPKKAA